MRRLAVLSLHTSPLAQPGVGDSGGMNVYVRELSAALARSGVTCDVFTRSTSPELPPTVEVEPGLSVHHVVAGPQSYVPKELLPALVDEYTYEVMRLMRSSEESQDFGTDDGRFEAIHANYWLSGLSGHVIKHEMDLPLVSTFHTLDRVKAEADPEEIEADLASSRAEAEAGIIGCSDAILASCSVEANQIAELYGADPARIHVVAPGVDHAFFGPGSPSQARRALRFPSDEPLIVFVGRIQPLKGADLAVRTLAELNSDGSRYRLAIIGGPSGRHGMDAYNGLQSLARQLGVLHQISFVDPQPHELLSTYYRAADVCMVPSRSESFGLVALEASACGTPVVASAVGGLTTLVDHGKTGFLVHDSSASTYAAYVRRIVSDPLLAEHFAISSVRRARSYTWRSAAAVLRELHNELISDRLVECR